MANAPDSKQSVEEISAPRQAAEPTHFAFQHKLFHIPQCYFRTTVGQDSVQFVTPLGNLEASTPLQSIRAQFGLHPGTPDGDLLNTVERSLKFVKKIAPGDSIPAEILDGSASWRVEERHTVTAQARISVGVLSWIGGKAVPDGEDTNFVSIAERPENKERIVAAFETAAEKLGIGKVNKAQVVDRINTLTKEFAYIEALRDRQLAILGVLRGVRAAQVTYIKDRRVFQDAARVAFLMSEPVKGYQAQFRKLDALVDDVGVALRRLQDTVMSIRKGRDNLHHCFMIWDELILAWQNVEVSKSRQIENLLQSTYRFVARYFPHGQEWSLYR